VECNPEEGWAKYKVNRYSSYGNKLEKNAGEFITGQGLGIRLYHIIWVFHTNGKWAKKIDHKNGNTRNNKIGNLREATQSQNSMNTNIRINNSSGVTGVFGSHIIEDGKLFSISITIEFINEVLGHLKRR
jgi:hypothetical protein